VPFVDVLTTMLDDTLPLTPPEWPEWGNPIASADDYRTIAAYSPYDNVAALDYPPILAVAGLTDPRVTYWEPAKWVARLRERKSGDNQQSGAVQDQHGFRPCRRLGPLLAA
jgi:oligopeptidase B